jgi:hypothetical protein
VSQPELRIEEVEVEDALGPVGEDESWPAVAIAELDGATGFLAAEDADEPFAEAAVADLFLDEVFLAVPALEVDVRSVVPGSEILGVFDEEIGFLLGEGEEILAFNAEGMVYEAVEVVFVGEREVSLEDDAIMAAENGDEGGVELDEEGVRRLHGVLLRKGASATPFCKQNASCALTSLVAAIAELGKIDGLEVIALVVQ